MPDTADYIRCFFCSAINKRGEKCKNKECYSNVDHENNPKEN